MPTSPPADTEPLLSAEHQDVLRALRQLPDRQREVLTLRYWSDLSEAQIAEALGICKGVGEVQRQPWHAPAHRAAGGFPMSTIEQRLRAALAAKSDAVNLVNYLRRAARDRARCW